MRPDERESTDAFSWSGIEQALDRLAADVATSLPPDAARAELFAIAGEIDDGADAAFAAVADRIRVLASALSDLNGGDVVGAALAAVRARDGAADAPAPATPDDDGAAYAADPELGALFVGDALDHLATIESTILQLETAPGDAKLLNDVFRPFHTVKGNAGVLGLMSIREFAHHLETLLDLVRSGKHAMGTAEVEVVLGSVDLLALIIRELPARAAGQAGTDVSQRRAELLDAVAALIAGGEAHAASPPVAAAGATAAPPSTDRGTAKRERADESQSTVKVNTRKLDALLDMVGELVIAQSILAEDPELVRMRDERLNDRLGQLKRITSELQRSAMAMRMVPIRQTFQKMARLVRDMAREFDKPITLVASGEETELDRRVVEHLTDPLMHLIRNCIDHGIEGAPERAAAGKPVTAELRLSAAHQAGNIVVQVSDDGAGLDTDRIRATAIARGLVHADATLTPADIHQLIFQPGFSTAARVTETSGRGVGMDVVRRNVEALRGRIDIQTSAGRGTTFTIRLPLTLAIVDGLVLSVGAERFVIPTFAVRESLRPLPEQVHTLEGRPRIVCVRDRLIPLLHLGSVFGIAGARADIAESTVIIVEDEDRPVALVVDELLGKYEVVIKSLGDAFGTIRGVAGGAILGDGRIGLILDAAGLLALVGTDSVVMTAA
jgi:two-component system chemotaxis sensor kinase CheA